MIDLTFFDANLFIGRGNTAVSYKPAVSGKMLHDYLEKKGIARALPYHIAQREYSISVGNQLCAAEIEAFPRLFGCWTILPPQTGELPPPETFFKAMEEKRIKALRIFPEEHRYLPRREVFKGFLEEVSKRKLPLLLSVMEGSGIEYSQVYDLLAQYPRLTSVLCDTGIWGASRYLRPLLEEYPNLFIETSFIAAQDGITESLVRDYGAERLLFGSGFPEREPESAMLQLLHAEITPAEKRLIAGENLTRLLEEVRI